MPIHVKDRKVVLTQEVTKQELQTFELIIGWDVSTDPAHTYGVMVIALTVGAYFFSWPCELNEPLWSGDNEMIADVFPATLIHMDVSNSFNVPAIVIIGRVRAMQNDPVDFPQLISSPHTQQSRSLAELVLKARFPAGP